MFLVRLLLAFALVASLAGQGLCAPAKPYSLTVLHTNDIHAHLAEFDRLGQTCTAEESAAGNCFGGYPRIVAAVEAARKKGGNILLLDAGDLFQGTLFYGALKGRAIKECVNQLRYNAITLGNHEFDDGPAVLADTFLTGLKVPVLVANIDVSREPALKDRLKPSMLLSVGERKIGLVGLTNERTARMSSPGPNVAFKDAAEPMAQAAKALRAQGASIVIAISHLGYQRDITLAQVVDGVDLIVGGHTHTLLSSTDPKAAGPYPTVVKSPSGKPVLIVQAKSWGEYLGAITLEFDAKGELASYAGAPLHLDKTQPQDPAMLERVKGWQKEIEPYANRLVGRITEAAGAGCRQGECALGDLMADSLRMAAKSQGAQAAFINGGAIRSGLRAGDVYAGDLKTMYPFEDSVATFDLSGADLKAVLEHSAAALDNPDAPGTGRFLQVSGLRYSFDVHKPAGQRIGSVSIMEPGGEFVAVAPEKTYTLASTGYLAKGGDGYAMLKDKAKRVYAFGVPVSDAVADYLASHSPYTPRLDGRILRMGETLGK